MWIFLMYFERLCPTKTQQIKMEYFSARLKSTNRLMVASGALILLIRKMRLQSRRKASGLKEKCCPISLFTTHNMQNVLYVYFKDQGDDAVASSRVILVHHVQLADKIHEMCS